MKKKTLISLLIFFCFIIIFVVYLNRAYAHIYNTIGAANLPYPQTREYAVGPKTVSTTKVVFLGDSLTAGVGVKWLEDTYPYQATKSFSEKQKQLVSVLNLGVLSAKSVDVLSNQIQLANQFKPDKAVVFIGTNDIHNRTGVENFKINLEKIVSSLNLNKNNIYLVNLFPLGNNKLLLPPYNWYFAWQTERYNQAFTGLQKNGYQVIDLSVVGEQFKNNNGLYTTDHFHPSGDGYKLISKVIYERMTGK